MALTGPEFYDDENVFATYAARRVRPGGAYETLEKPVFDELVGDLTGLAKRWPATRLVMLFFLASRPSTTM